MFNGKNVLLAPFFKSMGIEYKVEMRQQVCREPTLSKKKMQ